MTVRRVLSNVDGAKPAAAGRRSGGRGGVPSSGLSRAAHSFDFERGAAHDSGGDVAPPSSRQNLKSVGTPPLRRRSASPRASPAVPRPLPPLSHSPRVNGASFPAADPLHPLPARADQPPGGDGRVRDRLWQWMDASFPPQPPSSPSLPPPSEPQPLPLRRPCNRARDGRRGAVGPLNGSSGSSSGVTRVEGGGDGGGGGGDGGGGLGGCSGSNSSGVVRSHARNAAQAGPGPALGEFRPL